MTAALSEYPDYVGGHWITGIPEARRGKGALAATVPMAGLQAGRYHTALLAGGVVLVFGGNADGQLGLGDDIPRARPTLLPSPDRGVALRPFGIARGQRGLGFDLILPPKC